MTPENRYNICKECTDFLRTTKRCKLCGCIMPLKVRLPKAKCPAGKW